MIGTIALAGAGLVAWKALRILKMIHLEAQDHRASFTYVAEMSFAHEEHERKWAEARNRRLGPARPAAREGQDKMNFFFVDWAGE